MDGICAISVVDEAHNCLSTLAHHESRSRCDAIVANESGLSEVRVDLLLERLDIDLVIINRWAVGECELPWMKSVQKVLV